jgi:hypothetical protein
LTGWPREGDLDRKSRKAVVEIARLRKKLAQGFFGDLEEHEAGAVVGLLKMRSPKAADLSSSNTKFTGDLHHLSASGRTRFLSLKDRVFA